MRTQRLIRTRGKRRKIPQVDLDITSLLDVLVIMLVFLLKSYNSAGVVFNVPKNISLPRSESTTQNTNGVLVQVSAATIWVDDKVIYDINKSKGVNIYDQNKLRIIPLYNELVKKKKTIKEVQKNSSNANEFSGIANLIVDKSIKYSFLKKIMYTCAEAGFQKYKFVVLGNQQD